MRKIELVCQGYHPFNPSDIQYPTTTNPYLEGWVRISSIIFDPKKKPVWICAECHRRYIHKDLQDDLKRAREERIKNEGIYELEEQVCFKHRT